MLSRSSALAWPESLSEGARIVLKREGSPSFEEVARGLAVTRGEFDAAVAAQKDLADPVTGFRKILGATRATAKVATELYDRETPGSPVGLPAGNRRDRARPRPVRPPRPPGRLRRRRKTLRGRRRGLLRGGGPPPRRAPAPGRAGRCDADTPLRPRLPVGSDRPRFARALSSRRRSSGTARREFSSPAGPTSSRRRNGERRASSTSRRRSRASSDFRSTRPSKGNRSPGSGRARPRSRRRRGRRSRRWSGSSRRPWRRTRRGSPTSSRRS